MQYEMAEGWTELESGVYYREVAMKDTKQEFPIIKNNKVTVKNTVTKQDIIPNPNIPISNFSGSFSISFL